MSDFVGDFNDITDAQAALREHALENSVNHYQIYDTVKREVVEGEPI